MSHEPEPQSEIIPYQTEDGRTRVQCRSENETLWLTQALLAQLFEKDVRTINEHLMNIFEEGELRWEATIRKFRIVRSEGARQVTREVEHYNLDTILAVGFRVRSHPGTQFRQWAMGRLNEYLVKGFTMDDERLKNPPGKGQTDYFDEQLERIRDIRSSERRFYQKVLDRLYIRALASRSRQVNMRTLFGDAINIYDIQRVVAHEPTPSNKCWGRLSSIYSGRSSQLLCRRKMGAGCSRHFRSGMRTTCMLIDNYQLNRIQSTRR